MMKTENFVVIEKAFGEVKFLGQLIWFTIADCRITRENLARRFELAGLDPQYLPRPINPRDAFRKACQGAERKRVPLVGGKFLNILVREVSAGQVMVRQIVREIVDAQNVRLVYEPTVNLVLENANLTATRLPHAPADGLEVEIETAVAGEILKEYKIAREHYNGTNIRDLVMTILRTCAPVAVRPSGGVYFVPQAHQETVESLKAFVNGLEDVAVSDHAPRMWSVPVIDVEEQRKMIMESLEGQVKIEAARLINEMTELVKSGKKITQAMSQRYIERTRALADLVRQYKEMLETNKIAAEADLEIAAAQAAELLNRVA